MALLQRGSCGLGEKVNRALAAGAAAVVLFNEGQGPGRTEGAARLRRPGALNPPRGRQLHRIGESLAASLAAAQATGGEVTVRVAAWGAIKPRVAWNVLAETAAGREDRVIILGGHLDSVPAGPGIDDNGTGSATILEAPAVQVAALGIRPVNKLRFALWGGEELGLLGSNVADCWMRPHGPTSSPTSTST